MNKILLKEFAEFVANKPADEVINHSSLDSCAIGQFKQFVESGDGKVYHYLEFSTQKLFGLMSCESAETFPFPLSIIGSLLDSIPNAKDQVPTFGVLSEFIKENLQKDLDKLASVGYTVD